MGPIANAASTPFSLPTACSMKSLTDLIGQMTEKPKRIAVGLHVSIYARGKKRIFTACFHRDGIHCRQSLDTCNLKVAKELAARLEQELTRGVVTVNRGSGGEKVARI